MKSTIAVIGANGFIGSRVVEMLHLGRIAPVRPVVRSLSGLARSARFDLDLRIADAADTSALATALAGCDVAVHAAGGDNATIVNAVEPIYRASGLAGVRRIVYLSTASVHGQSPAPGTTESAALSQHQPIAYNNAKVKAELRLRRARANGDVEVVILRPGIVFGPRSNWIGGFADDILAGKAYVVRGARGICNSIYVDNLVHAVLLASNQSGVDNEAFFVGDREHVTWRDLYQPVAAALGTSVDDLPSVEPEVRQTDSRDLVQRIRESSLVRELRLRLPRRLARAAAACVRAWASGDVHDAAPVRPPRRIHVASLEQSLLQTCVWKFPNDKARAMLGYEPQVTFAEGCRRSTEWLAFAGYPVRELSAGPAAYA